MRVTSKGQVTIPKDIRKHLGIGPGSEVEFIEASDGAALVRLQRDVSGEESARKFRETLDRMSGTIDLGGMTTDDYMEWLRGPREDLDVR